MEHNKIAKSLYYYGMRGVCKHHAMIFSFVNITDIIVYDRGGETGYPRVPVPDFS